MTHFKLKDRCKVFETARSLSATLGDFAQNEYSLRETDILVEFIKVDTLIEQLLSYKRLIIQQTEQVL